MSDRYFRDFWIKADNGKTLYPALIRNRDTGVLRYQFLAKGTNVKEAGDETTDPIEAVSRFLKGESLRFGNEETPANRFDIDGGHVVEFGMTPDVWLKVR